MTVPALGLVPAAALLHATWNFRAKRVQGGAEFTWLFSVVSTALYAPVTAAVLSFQRPTFGPAQLTGLGVTVLPELFLREAAGKAHPFKGGMKGGLSVFNV